MLVEVVTRRLMTFAALNRLNLSEGLAASVTNIVNVVAKCEADSRR